MTDTGGATSTTQITVTIQGANDAPNNITGTLTIAENSANGAVVGTVTGQDVDSGETLTYSLTDTAGGRFTINAATGQVTVANGSLLNFEANTSHNITVRATDLSGATLDKLMSVTVTNVNETPTTLLLTGSTTNAGSSAVYDATFDKYYAIVSTAMTWEAAMDNAQASFLGGVSGTLININSAAEAALPQSWLGSSWIGATDRAQEGVWRWYNGDLAGLQLWAGNDQGIPAAGIYTKWASGEPNNAGGEDYAAHFGWWNGWLDWPSHFTEKSIVEWTGTAFRAAAGVSSSVMENAAAGAVLGTLSAADPDSGESLAYSIVGSNSLFEINGNELRVKAGAALDYEAARQHSLTVRVTDSNGNTRDQ
jgi:VCBS repeat-containing protein